MTSINRGFIKYSKTLQCCAATRWLCDMLSENTAKCYHHT